MGFFRRRTKPQELPLGSGESQVDRMMVEKMPVFLSKLHSEHPPRWVTVHADRLESVTGFESPEYMAEATNHEVWSVSHFVGDFPFVRGFLNEVQPGQTARFDDVSGKYTLDD